MSFAARNIGHGRGIASDWVAGISIPRSTFGGCGKSWHRTGHSKTSHVCGDFKARQTPVLAGG